jgi:hypothetical protein
MPQTETNKGKTGLNKRWKVVWMTRTAVFIALLVVLQAVSIMAGNQFVTGTIVNTVLVVCVMTCGLSSGLTLAVISPFVAAFFGIGPHWALAPFIALGNVVLVLLWDIIGNRIGKKRFAGLITALVCAALAKFTVLFLCVVKIAVPFILKLEELKAAMISSMFSIPQLINALLGGTVALIIITTYGRIIDRIKQGE